VTEIGEAVWLMRSLGVGAVIVCRGSTLFGTLSDRDIALANALPSEPIHTVMTPAPVYCYENDLLYDVHAMMRARGLTALPVRDLNGHFLGIVMRPV
jgi:CBS domain-containing protein